MTLDEFLKLPGANQWRGGEPPVSGDTTVEYMTTLGYALPESYPPERKKAADLDWQHNGPSIFAPIAYREVQP